MGSTSLIPPTCLGNYPCWLDILIRTHGLESMASMSSAWVGEPDGRGTWGLIQTCFLTLFLSIYSAIHLNIQPHQKSETIIPSTDRCFNTCHICAGFECGSEQTLLPCGSLSKSKGSGTTNLRDREVDSMLATSVTKKHNLSSVSAKPIDYVLFSKTTMVHLSAIRPPAH